TACGSSSKSQTATDNNAEALTVDQIIENPDLFVGKTITVDGVCSHLCKHGGRKAFLLSEGGTALLRCEATPEMGGAFAKECIRQPLKVSGILRENRIDETTLQQLEQQHAAQMEAMIAQGVENAETTEAAVGCSTEKAAHGQGDLNSFEARMADYRAKIAEREKAEGKPYFSDYYIEATSYELLAE
ncbi:MAG: hypothetical protein K2L49_05110, partial [Muribaculaceae bacterium]|nr:hypothetical protein [Muribaculaceae bacterium]